MSISSLDLTIACADLSSRLSSVNLGPYSSVNGVMSEIVRHAHHCANEVGGRLALSEQQIKELKQALTARAKIFASPMLTKVHKQSGMTEAVDRTKMIIDLAKSSMKRAEEYFKRDVDRAENKKAGVMKRARESIQRALRAAGKDDSDLAALGFED